MDELIISGKKYISSKRASEITGYAKDYIGQLARRGKIPGTRVGRAWYVDESKLISHENPEAPENESPQNKEAPKAAQHQSAAHFSRAHYPKHRTFRSVSHALAVAPKDFQKTWGAVRYFKDETLLFPALHGMHGLSINPIREENKIISDSRESNPVRLRVLKNALLVQAEAPRLPIAPSKPGEPASKLKTVPILVEKKKNAQFSPSPVFVYTNMHLAAAVAAVFFISAGILASGLLISSHLALSENTGAYTANAIFSYEHAREVVDSSPILEGGVRALTDFFSTIFSSFWTFFSIGLNFLLGLIHLV